MKLTKQLFGVALTAIAAGAFVSCTNELTDQSLKDQVAGLKLVKAPEVYAWSGQQTLGNTYDVNTKTVNPVTKGGEINTLGRIQDDNTESYFTVRMVEDDWVDAHKRNNAEGPYNINQILKWGVDNGWVDPVNGEKPSWLKEEWIKGEWQDYGCYIDVPAIFPEGTKGNDAVNLLNTNFAIKATQGYTITFYPYFSGDTDQDNKIMGLFYYDGEGNIYKKEIWNAAIDTYVGYNKGKIQGVEVTVQTDCVFGLYFSGRTHGSKVDDITYYSMEELNDPSELSSFPELTVHAGIIPKEALGGLFNGQVLMVEDWDDFDFDDFMIFITGNLEIVPEGELTDPTPGTGDDDDDDDDGDDDVCDRCKHPHHGPGNNDEVGSCDQCTNPGDGCYQEPEETDPKPTPGDKVCDNCGHKHDGPSNNCPDCIESGEPADGYHGTCTPDDSESSDPTKKPIGNEVEINLSINDIHTLPDGSQKYDVADLVSKLSMHVRYPHDVEVILPVPESVYCDQDDLYILKDHYFDENGDPNWEYGGEEHKITYVIGGYVKDEEGNIIEQNKSWTVTLGVEFIPANDDNLTNKNKVVTDKDGNQIKAGGYIRVYTEGICKELIDFLKDYYGDGINFEIYNYYNRGNQYTTGKYAEISYENLQYNYLSHSMVNFDWNWQTAANDDQEGQVLPDNYINAFNKVNLLPVKGDCYNWILGDSRANIDGVYLQSGGVISGSDTEVTWGDNTQRAEYANPYQGEHFNGSDLNWIYTLKAVGGVDSSDMPTDNNWPFVVSPWQYYKFGDSTTWNWGNVNSGSN